MHYYSESRLFPHESNTLKELEYLKEKNLLTIEKESFRKIKKIIKKKFPHGSKSRINDAALLGSNLKSNITRNGVSRISNYELSNILKPDLLQSIEYYSKKEVFSFMLELVEYEIKSVISNDFILKFKKTN